MHAARLAVVVALLAAPCPAPAQDTAFFTPPVNHVGLTLCRGLAAEAWVRVPLEAARLVDTTELLARVAHEAEHLRQVARYPTCPAAIAAIRVAPESVAVSEAGAWCAELAAHRTRGGPPRGFVASGPLLVQAASGVRLPDAVAIVRRVCPRVVALSP